MTRNRKIILGCFIVWLWIGAAIFLFFSNQPDKPVVVARTPPQSRASVPVRPLEPPLPLEEQLPTRLPSTPEPVHKTIPPITWRSMFQGETFELQASNPAGTHHFILRIQFSPSGEIEISSASGAPVANEKGIVQSGRWRLDGDRRFCSTHLSIPGCFAVRDDNPGWKLTRVSDGWSMRVVPLQ